MKNKEDEIYLINGRGFRLKEDFTLDDWEKSKVIDRFFGKMNEEVAKGKNAEMVREMTRDEFIDLVWCVLVPADGKPVERDFFAATPTPVGLKIFCDFFFIYLKLSITIGMVLTSFEKRANEYVKELKSRKESSN